MILRRRIAFVLVLASSGLLAWRATAQARTNQSQEVYEHAIRAIFREDVDVYQPKTIYVFKKSATLEALPDSNERSRFRDSTGGTLLWGDVPAALRKAFRDMVSESTTVSPAALPAKVRQRDSGDPRQITLAVSPITYAPDSTQALVYLEVHCGPVCGGGDIVYLRKSGLGWAVAATFPLWRS